LFRRSFAAYLFAKYLLRKYCREAKFAIERASD
jgi:hypothetical protein